MERVLTADSRGFPQIFSERKNGRFWMGNEEFSKGGG
jgi:hypothetical protein